MRPSTFNEIEVSIGRLRQKEKGKCKKKEYDFSKAKIHKGPLVVPNKENKIQKTFRLDEDVFEWLLIEGKRPHMK